MWAGMIRAVVTWWRIGGAILGCVLMVAARAGAVVPAAPDQHQVAAVGSLLSALRPAGPEQVVAPRLRRPQGEGADGPPVAAR